MREHLHTHMHSHKVIVQVIKLLFINISQKIGITVISVLSTTSMVPVFSVCVYVCCVCVYVCCVCVYTHAHVCVFIRVDSFQSAAILKCPSLSLHDIWSYISQESLSIGFLLALPYKHIIPMS